jgi:hypothetical protein
MNPSRCRPGVLPPRQSQPHLLVIDYNQADCNDVAVFSQPIILSQDAWSDKAMHKNFQM